MHGAAGERGGERLDIAAMRVGGDESRDGQDDAGEDEHQAKRDEPEEVFFQGRGSFFEKKEPKKLLRISAMGVGGGAAQNPKDVDVSVATKSKSFLVLFFKK